MDRETMVGRILERWDGASGEQLAQGLAWYPTFGRMIARLAEDYGFPFVEAAAAFAWLSPRVTVARNVEMFVQLLSIRSKGGDPFQSPGATFSMWSLLDKADRALSGDLSSMVLEPGTRSRKVRSFWRNLIGEDDVVTVDVWAARVATGMTPDRIDGRLYREIEAAYLEAARRRGVSGPEMQAVAWVVERGAAD